jgi:plasmid stability protein
VTPRRIRNLTGAKTVTLTVTVPADLVKRLRERAARNHRSLQRELLAILEQAGAASVNAEIRD